MDPEEDVVPFPLLVNPAPLLAMEGQGGGSHQLPGAPLSMASRRSLSIASTSHFNKTTQAHSRCLVRTTQSPLILHISPARDGEHLGHIYLATGELVHQAAIQAYFDSAGREVMTLPCPDFEGFLTSNSLRTRNVSLLCDLPEYILRLGRRILEDNVSSSEGVPDLSWLPNSPSGTLPALLSAGPTSSARRPANVTTRSRFLPPSQMSYRPDPDGIESPNAPIFFSMGGSVSSGHFSPLTASNIHSSRERSSPRNYILTQCSSESTQLPSGGALIMSSIAGSLVPTSSDSSESAPLASPVTVTASVTIKDKPLDLGIKPITDKDSWTEAKKIIDARLRRLPYWPGESKELVTTKANAAASVWWEEVIAFYCKPPVSNLFVEESCFDGKGFELHT